MKLFEGVIRIVRRQIFLAKVNLGKVFLALWFLICAANRVTQLYCPQLSDPFLAGFTQV